MDCFASLAMTTAEARCRCSSALQPRQQARRVPAPAAHLFHFGVELIDQRGDRQVGAVAAGFGGGEPHGLSPPLYRETAKSTSVIHGLVAGFHLPGVGGAPLSSLDPTR